LNHTRVPAAISAALLTCALAVALVPSAGAQSVSSMRSEIERAKAKIDAKEGKAKVLTSRIGALSGRIRGI
jgi:septal ring factor EnvC (AmiA/AmiB activator)